MLILIYLTKMRQHYIKVFCVCLLAFGCAAQKSNPKSYSEDLSSIRPRVVPVEDSAKKDSTPQHAEKIVVTPTRNVNAKVDAVLDSIDRFNLTRKFLDGYTILIYSGQKREEAMEAKKKMVEQAPDVVSNLQYQQPKFRVTVGKYYTRIEAQKDMVRLRKLFPNATLIPEKIMLVIK
jgi:Sporulation related domain.